MKNPKITVFMHLKCEFCFHTFAKMKALDSFSVAHIVTLRHASLSLGPIIKQLNAKNSHKKSDRKDQNNWLKTFSGAENIHNISASQPFKVHKRGKTEFSAKLQRKKNVTFEKESETFDWNVAAKCHENLNSDGYAKFPKKNLKKMHLEDLAVLTRQCRNPQFETNRQLFLFCKMRNHLMAGIKSRSKFLLWILALFFDLFG